MGLFGEEHELVGHEVRAYLVSLEDLLTNRFVVVQIFGVYAVLTYIFDLLDVKLELV